MNLNIKIKILESGKSQVALAREIGSAESILSKVVNGWIEPSEKLKRRIAKALNCKVEEIFPAETMSSTNGKECAGVIE